MKTVTTFLFLICLLTAQAERKDTVMLDEVVKIEKLSSNNFQSPFTEMKYQNGKRLSDVLGEFSSVYVKNYGVGQLSSIAVRGTSASQTEVQWNGIKLNSPSLGQCDLSLFTLGMQQDLQLVRTGYRGTIGGTLQMNNVLKIDSGISANLSLRAGSFKTFEGIGSVQYARKNISGTSSFSYLSAENNFQFQNIFKEGHPYQTQTNAVVRQLSFLQQLGGKINSHNELNFNLWLTEADRQIPPIMSKDAASESQYDYSLRSMLNWKAKYKLLKLSFTSAYIQDKLRYKNTEALIDETSLMQAFRNAFTTTYSFPFNLVLNAELNYDLERANVRAYGEAKSRNIFGMKFYTDYYLTNGLKFHFGFREDIVGKKPSVFAPELAINFSKRTKDAKHSFSSAVIASRNFRFPTLNDLYWVPGGNSDLKNERAWNGELNFKYANQKYFDISLNGFCLYVDDWIQWIPQGNIWMPVNYKRVLSRGFEASLHATNDKHNPKRFAIHFNASYTFTKTTNLDAANEFDQSAGMQLIYVPLHRVVAGVQLQYRKFYLRSVNSFVSRVFTSTDNVQFLKGYFLTDLEAGKDFTIDKYEIGMSFRVNNLANASYQNVAQHAMPGRNFEGTLRFKFD
ncbi:MAG: TonB-dependent receptor plug domain-containing protein [Bacteroidetes bacterium]|nr:TonB-dependent receptor plug domain-containing protein [Bacteroidota bacterium]